MVETKNKIETSRRAGELASSPRDDERNPRNWLHEFNVRETLGEGSFGKVKLGVHKLTGQRVALKFIDHAKILKTKYATKFRREMEIHKAVDHPNIVKVFQVIEAPQYQYSCIVMEYLSGEDLLDFVLKGENGRLDPKTAGKIFAQLISAVQYLHAEGVVHRDLKLENIMIDPSTLEIKIIDFGFANSSIMQRFSRPNTPPSSEEKWRSTRQSIIQTLSRCSKLLKLLSTNTLAL
eukprot:TRINITY_DN2344_c0_g1_i4.p1 TRINITY_DN2344_c0_g1~~TRINITY_DN2344_c0_g1_i4.p1  ORF type:complete len:235 (+),score=74.52 TRINITY_DN2344_c0_g1_i4:273-977(+)